VGDPICIDWAVLTLLARVEMGQCSRQAAMIHPRETITAEGEAMS
jgi:hypothetical protein